jgi:hypothetical protein
MADGLTIKKIVRRSRKNALRRLRHLRDELKLGTLPPSRPAVVRPVTWGRGPRHRIARAAACRPADELAARARPFWPQARRHRPADARRRAATPSAGRSRQPTAGTPNGSFIRKACYLWESFTGQRLDAGVAPGGPYVALFDPDRYVTSSGFTDTRWRLKFNGLGRLGYCPTVRRTAAIDAAVGDAVVLQTGARALVGARDREVRFLAGYDEVKRRIDERFDVRGSDLGTLVLGAHDHGGKVSQRRRKQFAHRVQPEAFDFIEEVVTEVFYAADSDRRGAESDADQRAK